jgi:uncharacterized Zn-binding protein involved in type VI secretion
LASINTGMPGISRNGDRCATGHLCTKVAPVKASQRTVFADGIAMLRRGDKVKPHTRDFPNPTPPPPFICLVHRAKVKQGARAVFVQGIPVARRGDRADEGKMIGASKSVFAG